jgi:hypothetical protein
VPPTFGFNQDEIKLLLVAVRQMRRPFTQARKAKSDPALEAYAALYDADPRQSRDPALKEGGGRWWGRLPGCYAGI